MFVFMCFFLYQQQSHRLVEPPHCASQEEPQQHRQRHQNQAAPASADAARSQEPGLRSASTLTRGRATSSASTEKSKTSTTAPQHTSEQSPPRAAAATRPAAAPQGRSRSPRADAAPSSAARGSSGRTSSSAAGTLLSAKRTRPLFSGDPHDQLPCRQHKASSVDGQVELEDAQAEEVSDHQQQGSPAQPWAPARTVRA